MMRALVTVTPRMYREVIALSVQLAVLAVRLASPGATGSELADFRPHLLVHSDNDMLGPEPGADIPCRVEVHTATAWTPGSPSAARSQQRATRPLRICSWSSIGR